METITFYSYKGGVGRTLALANVAIYLSRFGKNVCIMDFDLEAPGLHYKFPKFLKTTDIKAGLVDYIYEFTHNEAIPKSLNKFSLEVIPHSKSQGGIRSIPAGNVISPEYWKKLSSIDWHRLFYEENSEGAPFFIELKERIEKEFKPDFLLIDSRTGVTEMGGLCTSLLPDKVVFLIINNRENIEGARQILHSIQKVEWLPEQKPIEVTFALTRIPSPAEDKDKEAEKKIVKSIQNFLNEPVEDLERQLSIEDICILHSDRELELSESLRISQEGISEGTPLSRDYLRLFSKIIPENIIMPKLDSILNEITDKSVDPDKTQKELEDLVKIYPHPKSFEKLIDFYILRNEKREKVLNLFYDLWRTFGINDPKTLSKYISLFMKWDLSFQSRKGIYSKFELEIIEKYLKSTPEDRIDVEMRLSKAYEEYDKPKMALKHYFRIVDEVKEKNEILMKILNIYSNEKQYSDAMKLFEKYSNIIDSDISLRMKKLKIMFETENIEEIRKLLDDGGITEKNLLDKELFLYFDVMSILGKSNEANNKMDEMLNGALKSSDRRILVKVVTLFLRLNRRSDLENKLSGHSMAERILDEITLDMGD